MGSGKSTIGKKLAEKLKLPYTDLDLYLESSTGKTISQLFATYGEDVFRKNEHNCLLELLATNPQQVIALGGGTVCYFNSVKLIKEKGVLIYLKTDAATLYDRLLDESKHRPLLENVVGDNLRNFIEKKLEEREKDYKQADLTIDANKPVKEVVKEIITRLPQ